MFIIQLKEGMWIAPWNGDPPRTLVREHAKQYKTERGAKSAVTYFKKRYPYRKLENTKIIPF